MEALSHSLRGTFDSNLEHVTRAVDGRPYQDEAASSLSFAYLLEDFVCQSLAELPAIESPGDILNSGSCNLLF